MRPAIPGWLITLMLFLFASAGDAFAQPQPSSWTPIRQIPNYDRISRAPHMAAGPDGMIHAFNAEADTDWGQIIVYQQWSLDRGWSNANAILLASAPGQAMGIFGAHVDESNVIHLIYYSGFTEGATVYYTFAPASEANKAAGWSTPEPIALNGGPLFNGALVSDDQDTIIVVFQGQDNHRLTGPGLYVTYSEDGGANWSFPEPFFFTYSDELWPWSVRLLLADDGILHAVWSVTNVLGVGDEVYYSRLEHLDGQWSKPYLLAQREGDDYSANWPTIIADGDKLLVVYQDGFPAARFMRRSLDGGDTWLEVERPFPHIGEYENPVLLKDSSGTIHLITGSRIGDPGIHGMWHAIWLGERWGNLSPITSGPKTETYDPSAPQAIMAQGNILLATWRNDATRDNLTGAWYSYTLLDTPAITPSFSLPATSTPSASTDLAETILNPQGEPLSDRPVNLPEYGKETDGTLAAPLYMAILSSFLLVVAIFGINHFRKSR